MALGTMLLFSSLFAVFLIFLATLLWGFNPQDFDGHKTDAVIPVILMLSVCGGLGGGVLVFALTSKKTEE